jgi:hypothetical protein
MDSVGGHDLPARFWRHVDTSGDCWLWTGARYRDGYGQFAVDLTTRAAHRVAFELTYGSIAQRTRVLQTCQNRICVRPEHLRLRTVGIPAEVRSAPGRTARGNRGGTSTHPANIRRAETHYARQFTWRQVREMRQRYAAGEVTTRMLAVEYHVRQNTIWKIVTGRSWAEPHDSDSS